MSAAQTSAGRSGGEPLRPAGHHDAFVAEMNSRRPIVDNAGDGRIDGPGECTCPALPAGHDDAECAAATWGAA